MIQKYAYKKIARERIKILLELARRNVKTDERLARRYVEIARKIAMRTNFRMKKLKRTFCKECNTPLVPGYTARIRLSKKHRTINVTCLNCGKIYRYPYKPMGGVGQ